MTSRQQRVLRGALVASVATLLAATSHTLGGAAAPAPLLIALIAALATPVAAALVGPRPHLGRLAAAVALSQVAFHAAFLLLGSPTGDRVTAAHAHGQLDPALIAARPAVVEGLAMYVAHAIAALLTVALLWRGERAVRAILGAVLAVLRRAVTARIRPRTAARTRPAARAAHLRPALLPGSLTRRGPPALAGA